MFRVIRVLENFQEVIITERTSAFSGGQARFPLYTRDNGFPSQLVKSFLQEYRVSSNHQSHKLTACAPSLTEKAFEKKYLQCRISNSLYRNCRELCIPLMLVTWGVRESRLLTCLPFRREKTPTNEVFKKKSCPPWNLHYCRCARPASERFGDNPLFAS